MEQYLADLEAGRFPDSADYARRYPAIADELTRCLQGLEFIHHTAPQLSESSPMDELNALHELPGAWADAESQLGTLGDFRLVRELGRGGMGVVYEAHQISLNRRVALKILPFAAVLDSRQLQRFKNEAQAAAMLKHPHVVSVYSVGCERGVHYYAMELVQGPSLAEVIGGMRNAECGVRSEEHVVDGAGSCAASPDACAADAQARVHQKSQPDHQSALRTPNSALRTPHSALETAAVAALSTQRSSARRGYFQSIARLGIQAAQALDHAHQLGVIHRDIKPSNLLLDHDGQLWVTDFGLAVTQSGTANLTMSGDVLGTLRYMSPEQASGRRSVLDHRTDIYSLGATLYELLTLRPAFEGHDRQQLLRQIEEREPVAPRSLDSAIPKDLETIVLKALAKLPSDRYESAADFAEDLQHFLDDKPIRARRASVARRLMRWIRRHKLVSALLASLVLALVTLGIGGPIVGLRYARLAATEARSRKLAEANQQDLQRILTDTLARTAETLENQPGMTAFQRKLIDDVAQYYERLLERHKEDRQVRFEAALAFSRIARVERLGSNIERLVEHRKKAIAILEDLLIHEPSNSEYLWKLGVILRAHGTHYYYFNDVQPEESVRHCQRALQVMQRAKPAADNALPFQLDLAYTHNFLAGALRIQGAMEDAKRHVRSAEAVARDLLRQFPTEARVTACAAYTIAWLGTIETATGYYAIGQRRLREALQLYETTTVPSMITRANIAKAQDRGALGLTLHCLRRPGEAAGYLGTSVRELEDIIAEFGDIEWAHEALEFHSVSLSDVLLAQSQFEEAEAVLRSVLAKRLTPTGLLRMTTAKYRLGQILCLRGREDEGRQCFEEVLAQLDQIVPRRADGLRAILLSTCPVSELPDVQRAVRCARSYLHPQDGSRWQILGVALYRAGDWPGARDAFQQAIQRRNGGDAFDYFYLAMISQRMEDAEEASKWYRKAITSYDSPVGFSDLVRPFDLPRLRAEAEELLGSTLDEL